MRGLESFLNQKQLSISSMGKLEFIVKDASSRSNNREFSFKTMPYLADSKMPYCEKPVSQHFKEKAHVVKKCAKKLMLKGVGFKHI